MLLAYQSSARLRRLNDRPMDCHQSQSGHGRRPFARCGEMDRLATKIEPQTQSKQIDEIRGSFDVQPTVAFKPNVDRERRRAMGRVLDGAI